MKKDKDILIRVGKDLKEKITQKAKNKGLSVSSYIRMLIINDLENENN